MLVFFVVVFCLLGECAGIVCLHTRVHDTTQGEGKRWRSYFPY